MELNAILADLGSEAAKRTFLLACKFCFERRNHPWYDARLTDNYEIGRRFVAAVRPERLADFEAAFRVFEVDPGFRTQYRPGLLSQDEFGALEKAVATLESAKFETTERERHGRFKIRNSPRFEAIARKLRPWVEGIVDEPLELSFTLFSRYDGSGKLPPHLDSPDSKWSLGICLASPRPWPIHVSRPIAWPPEPLPDGTPLDAVAADPSLEFGEVLLSPNDAVLFSGNAQWHYRDAAPDFGAAHFDILYLMYVRRGSKPLTRPAEWADFFGMPELEQLHRAFELKAQGRMAGSRQ